MIQFENEANCASTDPEIFFSKNSVLGYWGNTTETQRRAIRRKRGIKPEPLLEREREYDLSDDSSRSSAGVSDI
jgi:hypothetical protein